MRTRLREHGLQLLSGRGPILEVAREVSRVLKAAGVDAPVVGGLAVLLHGYVRATLDVDLYTTAPERVAEVLKAAGFEWDRRRREFVKHGVPVQLLFPEQIPTPPRERVERDGVITVGLADLIEMKLRSGSKTVTRAKDLGDVVALIRHHRLGGAFARYLPKDLRATYRKVAKAVAEEG